MEQNKVTLDARTLEAMRKLSKVVFENKTLVEAQETVAAYMKQHDAATAASRDEALAKVLCDTFCQRERLSVRWEAIDEKEKGHYLAEARAARAHIAQEQAQ